MKRLFATLIAALLVLGALPAIGLAAGLLDGIDNTKAPFVDDSGQILTTVADGDVTDGKVISIKVNPELFKAGGADLDVSAMVADDRAKLRVVETGGKQAELEQQFTLAFRFATDPDLGTPTAVLIGLTAKSGAFDVPFSYSLGIGYTSNGTDISQTADNTKPVAFSGTLKAKDGSIFGFANANAYVVNGGTSSGGTGWDGNTLKLPCGSGAVTLDIVLPDNLFSYIGNTDSVLTEQKLIDYAFDTSNPTSGPTAALNKATKTVTAVIAPPATGQYEFTLRGKNSLNADISKTFTINVEVAGPEITGIALDPAGTLLTLNDKSNIEDVGNGLDKLALGQAVTAKVPVNNFTITDTGNAGGDINNVVAYLNANHKSWIGISGFSGEYFADGSDVGIRLTPNNAATFTNPTLAFNGKSLKLANNKLVVYNSAGSPVYLGIESGAAVSPSDSKSEMVTGNTMTYIMEGNLFNWSHGAAPSSFADNLTSNLTVSGLPSNFSYAFVYDSALAKTVLRITATGAGTVNAGSFTLTDNNSLVPTPKTLTLSYPKVVISNQISATGNKITGISGGAYLGNSITLDGSVYSGNTGDILVRAGSVMYLDFDSDFFAWDKGNPNPTVNVTTSMLSSGRVAVKLTRRSGGDAVAGVSIVSESGRARIKVEFVKVFNSLKEKSFGATIYLQVDGSRHTGSQLEISGILENEVQYAYSGETYYDLTHSPVLEAQDTIRNAELYVGNDIYIHTTLTRNRSYYASTIIDYTNADLLAFDRNTYVEEIVHMETRNIPDTAKASFNTSERYYVYNSDGKYLGTTSDKVGLSSTYYFSTKRVSLNLGSITPVVEEEEASSGSVSSVPEAPPAAPPASEPSQGAAGQTGGGSSWDLTVYNPPNGAAPSSPKLLISLTSLLFAGYLALTGGKER